MVNITTPLKFEIKSYHSCKGMEDMAYDCVLWINGQKACDVQYGGDGGETSFRWHSQELQHAWDAHVAGLPQWEMSGKKFDHSDETAFGEIMNRFEEQRLVKRWCKTQVVFRLKEDKPGEWRTVKGKLTPAIKDWIDKNYGDRLDRIANEEVS
jgi:hypothetical protein